MIFCSIMLGPNGADEYLLFEMSYSLARPWILRQTLLPLQATTAIDMCCLPLEAGASRQGVLSRAKQLATPLCAWISSQYVLGLRQVCIVLTRFLAPVLYFRQIAGCIS